MSTPKVATGTIPFTHPSLPKDKPCETWYKVIGDLKSSTQRPLVTLHGGPGACHNYLIPLTALSTTHGIPIIFYDQLGNGNSTHMRDRRLDTDFWTPELFLAEFDNLLSHFGIQDNYDLLGQSWGGMLGSMHAVRQPTGLKNLVISNSPCSMVLWVEAQDVWKKELPDDVRETIEKHEAAGTYEDPEYEGAVMKFYERHLCRVKGEGDQKFPKDVMGSLEWLVKDDTVYRTMNGPSEFTVIGSLKTWDVRQELHKINVPTLVINGEYDEARDSTCYPFFTNIPKAKWYTFSGCSHMPMAEEPEKYNQVVGDFLVQK